MECSILKVWGSEMLDMVVDHVVQIYAGYGYVEEYPAERAYRDSRINRIFEGTNEINRLIITGWLMKRAMAGQLPLLPAIKQLMDEVMSGPSPAEDREGPLAAEHKLLANAQETDPVRGRRGLAEVHAGAGRPAGDHGRPGRLHHARSMRWSRAFCGRRSCGPPRRIRGAAGDRHDASTTRRRPSTRWNSSARKVIAAVAEGDMLRTQMAILRRLAKHEPADTIALGRQIARHVIEAGRYSL